MSEGDSTCRKKASDNNRKREGKVMIFEEGEQPDKRPSSKEGMPGKKLKHPGKSLRPDGLHIYR